MITRNFLSINTIQEARFSIFRMYNYVMHLSFFSMKHIFLALSKKYEDPFKGSKEYKSPIKGHAKAAIAVEA